MEENPLYFAVRGGDLNEIRSLLDAGADIRYRRPHGYDVLIDAMFHRDESQLIPILKLLIDRGAPLSGESSYRESALNIASRTSRFDVIRLLIKAGADSSLLQWTPLMQAIALRSLDDVSSLLASGADLSARDFWSRTPWLLSLQVGDVSKAKRLLSAGASRSDRGRCGKTPLSYPIAGHHAPMLAWLISEGFDPNEADEHGTTPIMEAAEKGATECAKILIDAGADIHRVKHGDSAIKNATTLEIVRLLISHGADLNDIDDQMRKTLTKLPTDRRLHVSRNDYDTAKHRRFGASNPQLMNFAFWKAMISSGESAYGAKQHFGANGNQTEAIWCFNRFGKSITELPDGRFIEIAGEHEDSYDPDFCIYNDVVVHHGDGTFDIYGYPRECFPPTDFHTATLVENSIYIIGSLGYRNERKPGETPVYRLDTDSFEIQKLSTSGEMPGWISRHKASFKEGRIHIRGGKVIALTDGAEKYDDNLISYYLDLTTLAWKRTL